MKDVRVKAGGDAEESYTQHFETRKWASILLALACLLPSNEKFIPSASFHRVVCRGLHLVLDLYFELSREDFPSSLLKKLESNLIPQALDAAYGIFRVRQQLKNSEKHFRGVKLHIILHFPELIRRFGNPKLWDTDTFESAHKEKVKLLYKMGSKRCSSIEREILGRVRL